jgi:hypothetical protein
VDTSQRQRNATVSYGWYTYRKAHAETVISALSLRYMQSIEIHSRAMILKVTFHCSLAAWVHSHKSRMTAPLCSVGSLAAKDLRGHLVLHQTFVSMGLQDDLQQAVVTYVHTCKSQI